MHVLLIHQAFAALDEPGGTRHHELARYLAGLGYEVTVIASPVSYLTGTRRTARTAWVQRKDEQGVHILRTYTYPALHKSFVHRFFSFISFMLSSFLAGLSVRQVDVVWGTSPPIFQGVTAWALARLKGAPFLFEVRDLWPAFPIQVGVLKQPLLIKASEWLERFLYHHADQVIVNSPGFIEHVSQRGARKVALLPNGSDPRMFDLQSDGKAFRQANKLGDGFIVLYAGAHGMSNDLEIVLQAAGLLQERSTIRFVFLGDGKEKRSLMVKAAEMGLANVCFLPPVSKDEMPGALAAADACIAILKPIPLYNTVYPNKVFDYMAAGKPVVLAIGGVIREVVEQAQAGIPVAPGDPQALAAAVRQLADDPAGGRLMGRRGRAFVEQRFDRAVLASQLAKLFQDLVAGSKNRRNFI
jgi:glycosyltransferase involved in cell wall biosynthesis